MSSFEHVELAQAANVSHDDTPLAGSAVFDGPSPSPPPDRNEAAAQPSGEEPQAAGPARGTGQDPLKEIEEVAELVVDTAVLAARDVTQLASEAAKEARQGFNTLATGLSSWWSSFDAPTQKPASNASSEDVRTGFERGGGSGGSGCSAAPAPLPSLQAEGPRQAIPPSDLQARLRHSPLLPAQPPPLLSTTVQADAVALAVKLGLEQGEALLESFACTLLQRYAAANGLTPDRELPFPGHLHVTSKHAVFVASDPALPPARLRIASLTSARRLGQGPVSAQRLVLSPAGTSDAVFAGFRDAGPESALALLEHLGSPESGPTDP